MSEQEPTNVVDDTLGRRQCHDDEDDQIMETQSTPPLSNDDDDDDNTNQEIDMLTATTEVVNTVAAPAPAPAPAAAEQLTTPQPDDEIMMAETEEAKDVDPVILSPPLLTNRITASPTTLVAPPPFLAQPPNATTTTAPTAVDQQPPTSSLQESSDYKNNHEQIVDVDEIVDVDDIVIESDGSSDHDAELLLQSELEKAYTVNEMILTPAPSRDDDVSIDVDDFIVEQQHQGDPDEKNDNNDKTAVTDNDLTKKNQVFADDGTHIPAAAPPPADPTAAAALVDSASFVLSLVKGEGEETTRKEEEITAYLSLMAAAATTTTTAATATATATATTTESSQVPALQESTTTTPLVVTEADSSEVPSSSASVSDDGKEDYSMAASTPPPPASASASASTPPHDQNDQKVGEEEEEEETTEQLSSSSPSSSVSYNPFASMTSNATTTTPNSSKDKDSNKKEKEMEPSTPLTEAPTMFFGDSDHDSNLSSASDDDENYDPDANCHIRTIYKIHRIIIKVMQNIAGLAVNFPKMTLIGFSLLSLGLVTAGLFTNFHVETDTHDLWPPQDSLSLDHAYWLIEDSYFGYDPVQLDIIIHKNGQNVLGKAGVERVFEVQEIFTNQRGYREGCAWAELFGDLYWVGQCSIDTVTDFWNESYALFEESVRDDDDAIQHLSSREYPNGVMVDVDTLMGKTKRNDDGLLTDAQSYLIKFNIPWSNVTVNFEREALQRMLRLREEWQDRGDEFVLDVRSHSSYSQEFLRAIQADLWLLPIACAIVALFTVFFAFGKCHRVESRGLLGIGAVLTIVASLMTSFGIMFLLGIPFTTQTIMIPFLMFGIGLDDAFILYGSYNRKSHIKDVKQRINSTIKDVGVSIFLTSLTSMLAFVLGSFSQIPAVRWLCQYAYPCIGIDFLYQITFFVALIVVDERRIQQGRMDYCTCIKVADSREELEMGSEEGGHPVVDMEAGIAPTTVTVPEPLEEKTPETPTKHVADRFMGWWAMQLLNPRVQTAALIGFAALAAGSIACATQLEQEFDFADLVPADSYVKSYYTSLNTFTTRNGEHAYAYFRGVDQGNPEVQDQMEAYIDDLVQKADVDEPVYFWLRDFRKYLADAPDNSTLHDLPFHWQIREFLKEDIYYELYDHDIGRSRRGVVFETRVAIHINVDIHGTQETTEMLSNLREISGSQPINQDAESGDEWKFFTYIGQYHLYEFYNTVVRELIFTTVMGVIAVTLIAFCFIPHWTAVLFVLPFISLLYINMLGWLYLAGVQINAISYVTLVMSIGLMIDYIMHILMRYYDSKGTRQQRMQETLTSMGSSIFLGAASTLLGILCLSMSTSDILQDVFISCVGLVMFGILNGLIFLPVTLALVGPE